MSKIQVTVNVEKSADELGQALVNLVKAAKDALADGWQPLSDVPSIVMAATTEVIAAAKVVKDVKADLAEDKVAFVQGLELRMAEVVGLFL